MTEITKSDLLFSFKTKNAAKYKILFEFYKDRFFNKGYPHTLIAKKIQEDLGIPISPYLISNLLKTIKKKYPENLIPPAPSNFSTKEISMRITPPKIQNDNTVFDMDKIPDDEKSKIIIKKNNNKF